LKQLGSESKNDTQSDEKFFFFSFFFQERVLKILEKEVWPFDEVPEEKPVTAFDEAKSEFSDRKKDYRFLASILKQGNEAAE